MFVGLSGLGADIFAYRVQSCDPQIFLRLAGLVPGVGQSWKCVTKYSWWHGPLQTCEYLLCGIVLLQKCVHLQISVPISRAFASKGVVGAVAHVMHQSDGCKG